MRDAHVDHTATGVLTAARTHAGSGTRHGRPGNHCAERQSAPGHPRTVDIARSDYRTVVAWSAGGIRAVLPAVLPRALPAVLPRAVAHRDRASAAAT